MVVMLTAAFSWTVFRHVRNWPAYNVIKVQTDYATQLAGHVGFLCAILSAFSSIAQLFFHHALYQYSINKMSDNIEKDSMDWT